MSRARIVIVEAADSDIRLDRWFRRHFPALGHGRLEKLLRTGQIRVDGGRARASTRVAAGRAVRVPPAVAADFDAQAERAHRPPVNPEDADYIRSRVLYRDDAMIAIDKPAGLAVQGGSKVRTSVDALLDALRFDSVERPRLVHRLDKDTSGVLAVARTRQAASFLVAAFREGRVGKEYWALVSGVPEPPRGIVDLALRKTVPREGRGESLRERVVGDPPGGKQARTAYAVVAEARRVSWLALAPETGRTHQVRVHCQAIGTPVLGDRKYGAGLPEIDGPPPVTRLMLHARRLALPRPAGGPPVSVTAPLDSDMQAQWSFWGFQEADSVASGLSFAGRAR